MSNLSDLLPAGASAKQITATDSGSGIASKAPVIMNASGTVTAISESSVSQSVGSIVAFDANTTDPGVQASVSIGGGQVVVAFRDTSDSNIGHAVVGTISGTTVTYGTPQVIRAGGTPYYFSIAYDPDTDQVGIVDNRGYLTLGTVSGTGVGATISFGTSVDFSGGGNYNVALIYDTSVDRFVVFWEGASGQYARVAQVSGTTVSYGTTNNFAGSTGIASKIFATYDSNLNAPVCVYVYANDSNNLWSVVGNTTGGGTNTIGFGAQTKILASTVNSYVGITYDSTEQKVIVTAETGGVGKALICTPSSAGGTLTVNQTLDFSASGTAYVRPSYNATANITEITYRTSDSYGKIYDGTFSGGTFSVANSLTYNSSNTQNQFNCENVGESTTFIGFSDQGGGTVAESIVYQPASTSTNLTAQAFVGVADSAISASAAGSIIVQGGTVSGVSEAAALRFGTSAVFESANAGVITETFDSTNNKVVVAYKDSGNSNYGTAAVGTVSGSSISFGTPAVFESAEVGELSAAFDSNENRVVISYRDAGNSNYGTAVVGQVSGTSISFGTAATFSGTNASYNTSTAFDSSNNKIVVSYRDNGNSNYGTAVVGTVSGASITFGTPVVYSAAGTTNYGSITYDSTSNKIVLCYQVSTDEKAIVGTVSGTSISFGSEATAAASSSPSFRSLSFDSTNNRVVDTYSDGSTGACTSVVGTVSGTSISFGTPVIADSANTGYVGSAFDVSTGKIVIVYNASSSGLANTGTVSGTTITFGDKVTFLSGDPNHVGAVYDSNANRVVVSYSDSTNSNYGTSIVASSGTAPLTVGTKYYVTPSGSFSSSAGDPSVNAGLAISTTSLLLNGDS